MTKYLIIAAAILVGALIGWIMARPGRPAVDETLVEEKRPVLFWPILAGLLVLMAGLFLLADHDRASKDAAYQPAVITDGEINAGHFNDQDINDQNTGQ